MNEAPMEYTWTGQTHCGRVRKNNEDAFLALMFDAQEVQYLGKEGEAPAEGNEFIFAVSDGMGGANAGEFASRSALQSMTDLIARQFHQRASDSLSDREQRLREFFQRVHEEVQKMGRHYLECRGMGATLSVGWFSGTSLHIGHVGDSRIYHLPAAGPMKQLTEDHTDAGRLRRQGSITEREGRIHPTRHLLERSIGAQPHAVEPQIATFPITRGDRFIFCTDGIIDGVWDKGMEKYVRTPPPYLIDLPPAERLVKEALEASGRDNLTAVVVETR
jgi:serine/threonine protein phosphatase PrpC